MILRGSDVKFVRSEENDAFALYVDGSLRVSGTPNDIVIYLLHSFDRSLQSVVLSSDVMETFSGIFPQKYWELDEIVEDRKNCEIF